jgi:tetratricopeptide (TPR) repeat protein
LIVTRDLNWLFREQTIVDQGVDAHVEVAEAGHGTGRLVALQIKSGKSQFVRRVQGGWTFYYDERERALWHGHTLPVMVVLADLERGTAYWQRISPETERRTPKKYAVTVPEHQTLNTAALQWTLAASGLEQIAAERFETHIGVLPPQVASTLKKHRAEGTASELLAHCLATGRGRPSATVRALLQERPTWMVSTDGWPWAVVGNYAALHDALMDSADAFELSALHESPTAGERMGVAALHSVSQPERAKALILRARELAGDRVPAAIAETVLAHPTESALPMPIDAVLKAAGKAVRDNANAQKFLAEQARRRRDDSAAVRHAQRALDLNPLDSAAMVVLAQVFLHRSSTPDAQTGDVRQAIALLQDAVSQRRRWSGQTTESLGMLAEVLFTHGRPKEALNWLLAPPLGTATEYEASDPDVLRHALVAAHAARPDLVEPIIERMGGDWRDRVVQVELGLVRLPEAEQESLWRTELDRADEEGDVIAMLTAVHRLARLGIDTSPRLEALEQAGVIPKDPRRLFSAMAKLRDHPEEGIARLRALAPQDLAAAHQLVAALDTFGLRDEAASACQAAFERFREPQFLARRAMFLCGDDVCPSAETALVEALHAGQAPADELDLATRLAAIEAQSDRAANAESRLAAAIAKQDETPVGAVWNLVRVQLQVAAETRAVATIERYRPAIRTGDEGELWFAAMRTVPWDSAVGSEAIALATQMDTNHPKLAVALLTHLVMSTRGVGDAGHDEPPELDEESGELPPRPTDDRPHVPGDLHRQAFAALEALSRAHGDTIRPRFVTFDDDGDPLQQIADVLRVSATPDLTELLDAVSHGIAPAGMVALALGRPYASVLVRRTAGPLVAISTDDGEYDDELAVAEKALGSAVVVDISTILVLTQLTDSEPILGQFAELLMARAARDDLLWAVLDAQGLSASVGSIGWDSQEDRPVFVALSEDDYRRIRSRTDALDAIAKRTFVRNERRSVIDGRLRSEIVGSPWAASIEVAAREGAALWCDDLGVRRVARAAGVAAFSTMAVVEVICESRLAADGHEAVEDVVALRERVAAQMLAEYVVDVPVSTPLLIDQAAAENWRANSAAAVVLSRPAWWHDQTTPVDELLKIYAAVSAGDSARLPEWQYAAMLGSARGLPAPAASHFLAVLALLGWAKQGAPSPSPGDLAAGCRNARRVASELGGLTDPMLALPAARSALQQAGFIRSEEAVQVLLAEFGTVDDPP